MTSFKLKNFLMVLGLILGQLAFAQDSDVEFYSKAADEHKVEFSALFRTEYKSIEEFKKMSQYQKRDMVDYSIKETTKYIFGPLTHRSLGGEQKGISIDAKWDQAFEKNGAVYLPYDYTGVWMVAKKAPKNLDFFLPLPYNSRQLRTPNWKNCTDNSSVDHSDYSFMWYYWDPQRLGCDHKIEVQFQLINPKLSDKTVQTVVSYPEYQNMIRDQKVSMTFAFGYVEDTKNPNPYIDQDYGMNQFRSFIAMTRADIGILKAKEEPIYESKYLGAIKASKQIGTRFTFLKDGLQFEVKIVAAADIAQMELFAESFAADHDSFFGWFGHSRVGNGFDAFQFNSLVRQNSNHYSMTPNYQLIYWAGCNSYSYYTKPFFDFKANLIDGDKTGTKSLDIISNGLPSYFSLNALNAEVLLKAMVNLDKPTSYQEIVDSIEKKSNQFGITVLVNVLGDEDNTK